MARLTQHPWIDGVVEDARFLRVQVAREAVAVRPTPGPLVVEYLDHLAEKYHVTYSPAEWIDRTVELVLAQSPRHVLELAYGAGLVARRLIPAVAGYVGIDIAGTAVARLSAHAVPGTAFVHAAAHELLSPAVRRALDVAGFTDAGPDCVLINSVTPCFPNVEYLTAVLHDAIQLVAPGGTIVVSDNCHAGLLDAYCHWLESVADPTATPREVAERARARAVVDDKLHVDPVVLAAAAASSGRDVRSAAYPKTLRTDTGLTRYLFDAVLRVDSRDPVRRPAVHVWSGIDALRTVISAGGLVRVTGIANGLLEPVDGAATPAELVVALAGVDAAVLLDEREPTRLAVVAPADAALVPVARLHHLPSHAHEPFAAFVAHRLGETMRVTLRRAGADTTDLQVTVEPDTDPVRRAVRAGEAAIAGAGLVRLPEFLHELDDVALLAMAATISSSGLFASGGTHTDAEIGDALGVAARHQWILRRWLAVLVAEGMLVAADRGYRAVQRVSRVAVEGAVDDIDRARRDLGYPPRLTRFFQTAVAGLDALLRDGVTPQALLFADGATDIAESVHRDNPINRYVNAVAAEVVRWAGAWHSTERPLRVLEIGAGIGDTTADVLTALGPMSVDYLFTDVSTPSLADASERFAGRTGLRYGTFDINADPAAQGVAEASLDVVLAANVLHYAHDIGTTLRSLHTLLAPAGLLVFVETTREIYRMLVSTQFLMSALPGHDRAGTRDRRAGTDLIFLDADGWRAELIAAGFAPLLCLPAVGHQLHPIGVHTFAAAR